MSVLKDLLHQTAKLSQLSKESYGGLGAGCPVRVSQRCAEFMDTVRARSKPKVVLFGIDPCPQCGNRCVCNMEGILHCYWIAAWLAVNVKNILLSTGN
jgi:hypothetical protein